MTSSSVPVRRVIVTIAGLAAGLALVAYLALWAVAGDERTVLNVTGPPTQSYSGAEGWPPGFTFPTTSSSTTTTAPAEVEPVTTIPAAPSSVPPAPAAAPQAHTHDHEDESPAAGHGQTALASWYSTAEMGDQTASGIPLDDSAYTFAHKTMAFGTAVQFCREGTCVTGTCTDRGPYAGGRTFDLSQALFAALAPLSAGQISVTWAVV